MGIPVHDERWRTEQRNDDYGITNVSEWRTPWPVGVCSSDRNVSVADHVDAGNNSTEDIQMSEIVACKKCVWYELLELRNDGHIQKRYHFCIRDRKRADYTGTDPITGAHKYEHFTGVVSADEKNAKNDCVQFMTPKMHRQMKRANKRMKKQRRTFR